MAALRNRLTNFLISGKYRAYRFSTSPFRAREGMMRRKCMQLPRFYIVRIIDSHIAKLNMGNRVN